MPNKKSKEVEVPLEKRPATYITAMKRIKQSEVLIQKPPTSHLFIFPRRGMFKLKTLAVNQFLEKEGK